MDDLHCPSGEFCGGELISGVQDIEEMMGDILSLLQRDFIGADIESAVDLHGVAAYDFSEELFGQPDGHLAFADSSWSYEDEQVFFFIFQF